MPWIRDTPENSFWTINATVPASLTAMSSPRTVPFSVATGSASPNVPPAARVRTKMAFASPHATTVSPSGLTASTGRSAVTLVFDSCVEAPKTPPTGRVDWRITLRVVPSTLSTCSHTSVVLPAASIAIFMSRAEP